MLGGVSTLVLRIFFVKLVRVPTGAMLNTIIPGDHLIAFKNLSEIERGQIVIYKYPGDANSYVARVIALPGETVQLRDKNVYVNGKSLDEEVVLVKTHEGDFFDVLTEISTEGSGPYKVFYDSDRDRESEPELQGDNGELDSYGLASPFLVPPSGYYLLGDNRDNSYDSRHRGPVPAELIWGTPKVVYWSIHPHSHQVRWNRLFQRIH